MFIAIIMLTIKNNYSFDTLYDKRTELTVVSFCPLVPLRPYNYTYVGIQSIYNCRKCDHYNVGTMALDVH